MLAAAWKVPTPLAAWADHHYFVGGKQKYCTSAIWSQIISFYSDNRPPLCHACRKCVAIFQPSYIIKMDCKISTSLKTRSFFFFSTDEFLLQPLPRCWYGDTAESSCKRLSICKRDLNPLTASVGHDAKHAGFCWFYPSECLIQYLWF